MKKAEIIVSLLALLLGTISLGIIIRLGNPTRIAAYLFGNRRVAAYHLADLFEGGIACFTFPVATGTVTVTG
jgi:hypothetical protein